MPQAPAEGDGAALAGFAGTSESAQQVRRCAARAARDACPVLLVGEPGTGKRWLARAIHALSANAGERLRTIDCATPESDSDNLSVHLAEPGTVVLASIDVLAPRAQKRLSAALRESVRVTGSAPAAARVIATAQRDPAVLARAGRFLTELAQVFDAATIHVPALRERSADLPEIVDTLARDIAERSRLPLLHLRSGALQLLAAQPWPGNLRELRDVLEQAALMHNAPWLDAAELQLILAVQSRAPPNPPPVRTVLPVAQGVAALELQAIRDALGAARGDRSVASKMLGISRDQLFDKLKKLLGKDGS